MDPNPLTQANWNQLALAAMMLFAFLFFMVNFAAAMLLGHAIIPSMVSSGHIPRFLEKARFFFYVMAGGAITSAIALFGLAIFLLRATIGDIWPRWFV